MIDPELVTRKTVLILRDLESLRPFAAKERSAYLESHIDELVVERCLERIIGRMIDINYHLLTESGQAPPPDYYSSFTRLAEIAVLDREFASRLAACAGLRNRIVHEYNELDPSKVFDALRLAIDDVPRYLERVHDFVTRHSDA